MNQQCDKSERCMHGVWKADHCWACGKMADELLPASVPPTRPIHGFKCRRCGADWMEPPSCCADPASTSQGFGIAAETHRSSRPTTKSAGLCMYCGKDFQAADTSEGAIARVYADAIAHDQECPHNPLVKRISALSARAAPGWAFVEAALRKEHDRMQYAQDMFPQARDEIRASRTNLLEVIESVKFAKESGMPLPTAEEVAKCAAVDGTAKQS